MSSYFNPENLNDGLSQGNTLQVGQSANVVLTAYSPVPKKTGGVIPKHLAQNADTGENYEFFGFTFHQAFTKLFPKDATQEQIDAIFKPELTVLTVECVEGKNPKYPEYNVSISGTAKPKVATEDIGF